MIGFQQKRRLRQFLYSNLTLAVLFVVLIFFAHSTFKLWQKERDTKEAIDAEKSELATLAAKEASLSSRVASLKTDRGVEEAIREKFRVAKVGEGVVVVIDQSAAADNTATGASVLRALWQKFLSFFR